MEGTTPVPVERRLRRDRRQSDQPQTGPDRRSGDERRSKWRSLAFIAKRSTAVRRDKNRRSVPFRQRIVPFLRGIVWSQRTFAFVLLLLFVSLRQWDPAPVQLLRERGFDFIQSMRPNVMAPEPNVVIVDIDEKSLAKIGQWPWPRVLLAQLVENIILDYGALVVGFDIVFAEPDRVSPPKLAEFVRPYDPQTADALLKLPDSDEVFAAALKRTSVVAGQSGHFDESLGKGTPPVRTTIAEIGGDPRPYLLNFGGMVRNLPIIEEAAAGRGMFTVSPEPDGVVRRVPAIMSVGKDLYPTLSIEMLRVALGGSNIAIKSDLNGVKSVVVAGFEVPTDTSARVRPHFAHYDRPRYIPAIDILTGEVDPKRLNRKLVLLGTSALGLVDNKTTPVDQFLPGVEVHAQLIEGMIAGTLLTQWQWIAEGKIILDAKMAEILLAFVVGAMMIWLVPRFGAKPMLIMFFAIAGTLMGGTTYLFIEQRQLLDFIFPAGTSLVLFMLLGYLNYAREEAQKKQVRGAFSRYMSPALVEKLAQFPESLKLGGETRDMTIMFSDIRGFTTISEQFDAEGLTRFINRFLTPMTDIILKGRGTIDKYMGDAIMAFWNAPLDDEEHARHACRSGLAMMAECRLLNQRWKAEAEAEGRKFIPVNIGVGLNSGSVCVGNMGSDLRFDYSVLGDDVNLASRLEGQSKTYGVDIVIGKNTRDGVPDFATIEIDMIKVKGKTQPVRIFALLGDETVAATPSIQSLCKLNDALITSYRAQEWDKTLALIAQARPLGEGKLNTLYELYEERVAYYRENPPGADWDGVYVATSK